MYKFICIVFCTAFLSCSHGQILGVYDLDVKIGNRTFIDVLDVNEQHKNSIGGTFTVPNVFTAPFSGEVRDGVMKASFMASEGGGSFKVDLIAHLDGECGMKGSLSQQGQVFGRFTGAKRGCD
jgi:hypothetical protein